MNATPKVKSNSTLRNHCRRNATRSARIVPSDPAASSVAHTSSSFRWTPFAAAAASSRRRQPESVPDVVAQPRRARRQRETVREAAIDDLHWTQLPTVPDDEISRFVQSRRQRLMTATDASEADPVNPTSRQLPTVHENEISRFIQSRRQRLMTATDASAADPVNPTSRQLPTVHEYEISRFIPSGRQRLMTATDVSGPRNLNVVDLPQLQSPQLTRVRVSAPQLADVRNSDLNELLDCNMAILEFVRREAPFPMLGPIRLPTALFDRLVLASRNVGLHTSEVDEPGGMTEEEICRLPVRKVPNSAIPSQPCSICLKDYDRGDVLRVMPCHHEFHQKCLDQWLAIKRNCPVCRNAL